MKHIKTIADLTPDPHNTNKGTPRGAALLEKSLRTLGAGRSIVVDKNGFVIAGNQTLEQAASLDMEIREVKTDGNELVVVRRMDLDIETDKTARALAVADNRTSEIGLNWDLDALQADLAAGVDLGEWFHDSELDAFGLGGEKEEPPAPQIDKAEELQEHWQVKTGDLWVVPSDTVDGKAHRLLCGDCTVEADVGRLMGGEKAAAVITDPPYGIDYNYDKHDDSQDKWFDLMNLAVPMMRKLAPFVVMPSCKIARMGWWYKTHEPDWLIAWYKGSPGHRSAIGFNDWEPLLVWGKPPIQMHDYFQTECGFNDSKNHPCPKPVAWAVWLCKRAANNRDIILDPFLGSGTTMVAAEQEARLCFGIEISEKYCAVILQRMTDMGLEPEREA